MAHIFLRSKKRPEDSSSKDKKKETKARKAPGSSRLSHPKIKPKEESAPKAAPEKPKARERDDSQRTKSLPHPKIPVRGESGPEVAFERPKGRERDDSYRTRRLSHPKIPTREEGGPSPTAAPPTQTGWLPRLRGPKGDPAAPGAGQKIFKFRAIKYVGKEKNEVSGIMVGEDERDVTRRLQQTDHIIVSVRPKRGFELAEKVFGGRPTLRSSRVPLNDLVIFTQQLATMVEAGNPLLSSLEVLRDQSKNAALAHALEDTTEEIRKGASLSESLARHPKIFNELYVNLVKAGETSGRLALNLSDLATTLEEAAVLRSEIISAMTYPVISLLVIFGVSGAILLGVIPKFKEIFEGMHMELPLLTKAVLGLSEVLREQFVIVGAILVLAMIALHVYKKTERGRYRMDWLKLQLPIFGPLFEKVATARVCNIFALMIRSGVSTLIALEIAGEAAVNKVYAKEIIRIRDRVKDGWSLSDAFTEGRVFSFMVGHMLSVGEESGNVDMLLEKLAAFFKEQVRATIKRLTSAIEPIMIVTMGLVVGTMVLAIFLPIIELQKTMRGG